jgi:hypothetical protein
LPGLRTPTGGERPRAVAASGVGTAPDQTDRHRISAIPLDVWLLRRDDVRRASAGVPQSQAGPQLVAFVALLMGCFKQSKRRGALFLDQVLDQPCSPGWVVKLQNPARAALAPAYEELAAQLPVEPVLGIDESPTKEGRLKRAGCEPSSPATIRSLRCGPPGPPRSLRNCAPTPSMAWSTATGPRWIGTSAGRRGAGPT